VLSIIGPAAVVNQKMVNSITTDSDNPASAFKFNHLNWDLQIIIFIQIPIHFEIFEWKPWEYPTELA
jgi:hypothetical protein